MEFIRIGVSLFIIHGGGTEKSDGDDQIHGTDFKVDFFVYEIKAFH